MSLRMGHLVHGNFADGENRLDTLRHCMHSSQGAADGAVSGCSEAALRRSDANESQGWLGIERRELSEGY